MLKYHQFSSRPGSIVGSPHTSNCWSKWWFVMLLVLLGLRPALATENDDRYFKIYGLIEKGDALDKAGQIEKAKAKFVEAEAALRELKQHYPTYNTKLVASRLNYLAEKIDVLSKPAAAVEEEIETVKPSAVATKPRLPGEPQIKVIATGAEPRQVLRLQAQAGSKQKLKMTVRMKMGVVAPEIPSQMMTMPAMNLAATVTTKEVSPEGEAQIEIVIDEAGVSKDPAAPAEAVQEMEKQMTGLKGLTMTGAVTDRYFTRTLEAKIPAGTSGDQREGMEEMKDAFANAEFLLPEVAVGAGAKWEIKKKTKQQGMTIDETIRHELISVEGGKIVVKSTTTQSAANQKISNPIMPELKVDMTKMTGTAIETATIDLTQLLPVKAEVEEKTEINMSLNNGGKKQAMVMKTETQSSMEAE